MPTELHGILQLVLGQLLRLAGYRASTETELRIVPDWYPRPDVTGISGKPIERYQTRPIDVAFEVLSEGEDAIEKCALYSRIGIPQVFYFDPEKREIYSWDGNKLAPVIEVKLGNGAVITGEAIWAELEKELNK